MQPCTAERPHTAWPHEGVSNFDPRFDLSYALLVQQPQGNSQFGTQLLFFHPGEYIGIDSAFPQQVISIGSEAPDSSSHTKAGKLWRKRVARMLKPPTTPLS
ncbi:LppP/LprE family lipoprotein [Corynebacterium stationis]|uniref:LppP/LprE family lipoprotein n=1 Tax=Corynebacterium stationis TaxID=1705 RepID=UPI0035E45AA4